MSRDSSAEKTWDDYDEHMDKLQTRMLWETIIVILSFAFFAVCGALSFACCAAAGLLVAIVSGLCLMSDDIEFQYLDDFPPRYFERF